MQIVNNLEELEAVLRIDLSGYVMEIPVTHAGIRLGRAMDKVAQAIRQGDRSAVIVGYQIIIHDPHLPFGKIIKSNFARALKRHIDCLTMQEKMCLASKTAELLSLPFCPREVEDYCRLVKKMGHPVLDKVIAMARPGSEKARSLLVYLGMPEPPKRSVQG